MTNSRQKHFKKYVRPGDRRSGREIEERPKTPESYLLNNRTIEQRLGGSHHTQITSVCLKESCPADRNSDRDEDSPTVSKEDRPVPNSPMCFEGGKERREKGKTKKELLLSSIRLGRKDEAWC